MTTRPCYRCGGQLHAARSPFEVRYGHGAFHWEHVGGDRRCFLPGQTKSIGYAQPNPRDNLQLEDE